MHALSALLRHDDIVGCIMTFCPTFDSLQSTTLISKAFHHVFQTYPKAGGFSITRAVAYNIVGPTLSEALRVLRYPYSRDDEDGSMDPITLATTCPEDHDAGSVITVEEKIYLQEDSKSVAMLEDIYSQIKLASSPQPQRLT
ncbi:hypothetical protein B0H13DRAFT_1881120 [Mycena leptocephala]|nr:hypothetical protein B0H13DRAFT_1881120 [Mycena leptocephala]